MRVFMSQVEVDAVGLVTFGREVHNPGRIVGSEPVGFLRSHLEAQLAEALDGLVPKDFDDHPGDFMPEWHRARAALKAFRGEPA